MNNIERFKSGDQRLQIIVKGMPVEQKKLVQEAFFKLGWEWLGGGFHFLGEDMYTNNMFTLSEDCYERLLWGDLESLCNFYPTNSFTELMIIAEMVTLPEVIRYLDKDELEKYNIIGKENTLDKNTFTKDMLEAGKHVVETVNGVRWIVFNDMMVCSDGFMEATEYTNDLRLLDDDYTVDKVYEASDSKYGNGISAIFESRNLTLIWERKSQQQITLEQKRDSLKKELEEIEKSLEKF